MNKPVIIHTPWEQDLLRRAGSLESLGCKKNATTLRSTISATGIYDERSYRDALASIGLDSFGLRDAVARVRAEIEWTDILQRAEV